MKHNTARSNRRVCEGCEDPWNLIKVEKKNWLPFFMCKECLEEDVIECIEHGIEIKIYEREGNDI